MVNNTDQITRRNALKLTGGLIALSGIPTVYAEDANNWIGRSAVYNYITTEVKIDGTKSTNERTIEVEVVGKESDLIRLDIKTISEEETEVVSKVVPINSVYPPIRGEVENVTRKEQRFTRDLGSSSIEGSLNRGWFEQIIAVSESNESTFKMAIKLVNRTGADGTDSARGVILIPFLVSPPETELSQEQQNSQLALDALKENSEVINPENNSRDIIIQDLRQSYIESGLTTKDNAVAYITTSRSSFLSAIEWDTALGRFVHTQSTATMRHNTSANWSLRDKYGNYSLSGTIAYGNGRARFRGFFPLGDKTDWRENKFHKHTHRRDSRHLRLRSSIFYKKFFSGGNSWNFWKSKVHHDGPTGTYNESLWYIV